METLGELIKRVWSSIEEWQRLPIDRRINLKYNYVRTLNNRSKRGTIDAKQQTKKDK